MSKTGRIHYQVTQIAIWLSVNRSKTAFYGTLNAEWFLKYIDGLYPHLLLKIENSGVKIKFPACNR